MSKEIPLPSVTERSYPCPHCKVLCPQWHFVVYYDPTPTKPVATSLLFSHHNEVPGPSARNLVISVCSECNDYTVWYNTNMIFPFTSTVPDPIEGMPDDVREIYDEAANVFSFSKRASAGLLRLSIETLLINHLDLKQGRMVDMIGELVERDIPLHLQKGLDALRYYGNEGVHFGQINFDEKVEEVNFMFTLVNRLVYELIIKPREIEEFYAELPESLRKSVERRDS